MTMDTSENVNVHTRQWTLQPESEYRFELDPNTTLAIKVCPCACLVDIAASRAHSYLNVLLHSSSAAMPRSSARKWRTARLTSLARSARRPSIPGKGVP